MQTKTAAQEIITVTPSKLKTRLRQLLPLQEAILITGRPGIGKTEIVEEVTAELGYELIVDYPVLSDPTDYKGLPFAQNGLASFLPIGTIDRILKATKPTVVFFDDLGPATASVQAGLMNVVLSRRANGQSIPDCVTFVAATNRREDKSGVVGLIEAFKSRLSIFELEMTSDEWVQWALGKTYIPIELIAAVRFRPKWVEEWSPVKGIENVPSPRNLAKVGKFITAGVTGPDVYASRLGAAAAVELEAFLNMYANLPNIPEIIANPLGAPVPDKPDAQHAITTALTVKAADVNFPSMVEYVKRLPVEFEAYFMTSIAHRKRELTFSKEYVKWASANGNLILGNAN